LIKRNFIIFLLVILGCAPGRVNLDISAPSKQVTVERARLPIPVLVNVRAPTYIGSIKKSYVGNYIPSLKLYQYPLKAILEKAFQDTVYASFSEPERQIGEFCQIEVNVPIAKLEYSGDKADFYLEISGCFRDQRGRILEISNLSAKTHSGFDRKNTPRAVWDAAYEVANDFVNILYHSAKVRQVTIEEAIVHKPAKLIHITSRREVYKKKKEEYMDIPQLPQYDGNFALIVGTSHYKNIPSLPYPQRDVILMQEVVTKLMGVKNCNLFLLEDPTKSEIIAGIEKVVRLANTFDNPKVIFYFSGHGTAYAENGGGKGEGYLLPIEADPEDISTTSVSLREIENLLARAKGEKVVIIDACFSGKGKSILLAGKPFIGIKKVAPMIENTVIFLSSKETQISTYIKNKGVSTFTYALYEMLGKYGPVLDGNKNGWLEAREISEKLRDFTDDYAVRFANQHQHPVIRGNLDICLAQRP